MRIVYLHQYYKSPEEPGGIRSYHLSRALANAGHEVYLITAHNQTQTQKNLVYTAEQSPGQVWVYALPVFYHNRLSWTGRVWAFLRFVWASFQEASRIPGIDLVLATSTPLSIGLVALALQTFKAWPFVFEVRDLWPDAPIQMGYLRNPIWRALSRRLEKSIYRNAQGIIALSPPIAQAVRKRVLHTPICVVPNMADCSLHSLPRLNLPPLTIAYFGALGPANGLGSFLQIAQLAQKQAEKRLQFLIIGEGKEGPKLKELAQSWELQNLVFRPAQNREGLVKHLEEVSVAYISYAPYPILETGSPNKFFEALSMGLACLLNFKGWIWESVETNACGAYADPQLPQKGLEALQTYLENPKLLQKHQENARCLAEKQYDLKHLSLKWVHFLEEVSPKVGQAK